MLGAFKKFFIPHLENNYHPHILHTKRAVFYSLVFLFIKAVVVVFAVLLPAQVFLLPDILAQEGRNILALTNTIRQEKGLPLLTERTVLERSSQAKAADMAEQRYFSHNGLHNHTLSYFLDKAGYRYRVAGENLAMGFTDANSVINAWIKSPRHYANLIDKDYQEFGIGLESGLYDGQPTVYVAQHLGTAVVNAAAIPGEKKNVPLITPSTTTSQAASASTTARAGVQGEKLGSIATSTVATTATIVASIDHDASRVYWLEQSGATTFRVRARISGPVEKAVVYIANYPIELHAGKDPNEYTGVLTVHETANAFFRPVVIPTLIITTPSGERVADTIDWYNIKPVSITPVEQYLRAQKMLSPLTHLFGVSRALYVAFAIFFVTALLISIIVEVRKQHYHIIVQTLTMIGLLVVLWAF